MTTRLHDKTARTRRRTMSLRRRIAFASVACGMASAGILVVGEAALRARAGDWSLRYLGPAVGAVPVGPSAESLSSRGEASPTRFDPTRFDPRLGYLPAPGTHDWGAWRSTVLASGLRSNGATALDGPAAVLAVGDSFTFGDEVADHETWPARLELALGAPVANAGVFGYGLDQAVLRAERILDEATTPPRVVALALVSDDVARCELSCRHAFKPYFELDGDALVARHDPVPNTVPTLPLTHTIAGRSHVVRALARRLAPDWWHQHTIWRRHRDGERVAALLLQRLDERCHAYGVELVVIGLCGPSGDRSRLEPVLAACVEAGIATLDLAPELAQRPRSDFRPGGHLGPEASRAVAQAIAGHPVLSNPTLALDAGQETTQP